MDIDTLFHFGLYHHFFDRRSRLSIEVRRLGILRFHFLRVDFRVPDENTLPPLHATDFLYGQNQDSGVLREGKKSASE